MRSVTVGYISLDATEPVGAGLPDRRTAAIGRRSLPAISGQMSRGPLRSPIAGKTRSYSGPEWSSTAPINACAASSC